MFRGLHKMPQAWDPVASQEGAEAERDWKSQ